MIRLTIHHLRRHWRLNLVILIILTLASALLASLPMLAAILANDHLAQIVEDMPVSGRNLLLEAENLPVDSRPLLNNDNLAAAVVSIVEMREINIPAEEEFVRNGERHPYTSIFNFLRLHLRSFRDLEAHTVLVDGRYPAPQTDPNAPVIEVVLGEKAFDHFGIEIGDSLLIENDPRFYQVVGVVNPTDPTAERWWGDQLLLPFGHWERFVEFDNIESTAGVLVHHTTMTEALQTSLSQRLLIDHSQINTFNAAEIQQAIRNAESNLTGQNIALSTQLVQIISDYQLDLDQGQVTLLLLSSQALLAVAYLLILISTFMLEQSQKELITLIGRGFSKWQVIQLFGTEAAVLAYLLAWPLGIFSAWLIFFLYSGTSMLPLRSTWLALAGVTASWLALMIPLIAATSRHAEAWLRDQARPDVGQLRGRTLVFDAILLGLGGLFYWQLRQTGQLTTNPLSEATGAADPLLLLGPTILLLAIALIFTRFFPVLLRLFAWFSRQTEGWLTPLTLTRLARETAAPSRIVFLISLTTGLTFFALVYEQTVTIRQQEIAHYRAGADLRFVPPATALELPAGKINWETWDGVTAGTEVFRGRVQLQGNNSNITLFAIEPERFPAVATPYPNGLSQFPIETIAATLRSNDPNILPIVVSSQGLAPDQQVGDLFELRLSGSLNAPFLNVQITGIINQFPTIPTPFVITDLSLLKEQSALTSGALLFPGSHEIWLDVAAGQEAAVREQIHALHFDTAATPSQILGDRTALLRRYQADLISQQVIGAFQLNALVLIILSAAGFMTVQLFTARSRLPSMSVLRALGLSPTELMRLLLLEGLLVLVFGLLAGVAIGYGMSRIMSPFLTLTLASSLGGFTDAPLIFDWPLLLGLLAIIITLYITALYLFGRSVRRNQLSQVLRMGSE